MPYHAAALFLSAVEASAGLQVCTGPTCSRNGAKALLEYARALSANGGDHPPLSSTGCLRPCRGIVTKRANNFADRARRSERLVPLVPNSLEMNWRLRCATRMPLCITRPPMRAHWPPRSSTSYSLLLLRLLRCPSLGSSRSSASGNRAPHSPFASAAEAERILPGRVRWLYEALVGPCAAALEASARSAEPPSEQACTDAHDAHDATRLCGGYLARLGTATGYEMRRKPSVMTSSAWPRSPS